MINETKIIYKPLNRISCTQLSISGNNNLQTTKSDLEMAPTETDEPIKLAKSPRLKV